ncbi:sialic acid-binding Ig-like lectin 10, partial [Candoia aspera]|uniref:sialic acid-binding Ig-like lectin 10 n=1 Tax=Candoia aspera TaxID=51853 RepID=UPI002FD7FC3D
HFFFLGSGIRSKAGADYTVTVPPSVSVQRGFAVYIPCQFTYKKEYSFHSPNVFAYWFKVHPELSFCPGYDQTCIRGVLVATSDKYQTVVSSAKNRFYVIGEVGNQGNCSLIILNAQIEDEGQYYLRIEGNNQIKFSFVQEKGYTSPYVYVIEPSQKVNITVDITSPGKQGSSVQQRGLDHVVAQEGDTVQLLCTSDGRPHPNLSWMKGNQKIGQPRNSMQNNLQLSRIGPEDAGEYQCLANNQYGSVKAMVEVIVQYRPRTLIFKVSQTHRKGSTLTQGCSRDLANTSLLLAQEGDSLRLFCTVDSNPPATTSWMKGGSRLQNPPDNQLELTNLTVEDEGAYACEAKNLLGFVQGIFQLSVAYAPKLSRSPQHNTTCRYHNNGFLCSCSLHAQPPPHIEWEVDGERITEKSSRRGNLVTQTLIRNEVTSTLNWTGSLDRAHNIICLGNNSYGIHTMQFLLNDLGDPTSESSTGRSNTALFIAGLCGVLLGAGIFMLCLFLIRIYKQKEALSKADPVEGTIFGIGHHERPKNPSQIYSNIFPRGPRLPQNDQPKAAGESKSKPAQVSSIPSPRSAEPDELQYAALEFKLKSKGVSVSSDNHVEYSAIQRKPSP